MSSLLDDFVNWLIDLITAGFDIVINACQSAFSIDLTTFETVFPGAEKVYGALLGFSVAIVIVIFLFQISKCLNPMNEEAENPFTLLGRAFISLFFVMFGRNIIEVILDFGNNYFVRLQNVEGVGTTEVTGMASKVNTEILKNLKADKNFIVSGSAYGIAVRIVAFVFVIFIIYKFCQLTAHAIKNYIIMGVLASVVCLPAASAASKSTENIWKSYLKMLFGQAINLYMILWFTKIGSSALKAMSFPAMQANGKAVPTAATGLIWCLMIGYFFTMGISVNDYVYQLGLGAFTFSGESFGKKALKTGAKAAGFVATGGVSKTAGSIAKTAGGAGSFLGGLTKPASTPNTNGGNKVNDSKKSSNEGSNDKASDNKNSYGEDNNGKMPENQGIGDVNSRSNTKDMGKKDADKSNAMSNSVAAKAGMSKALGQALSGKEAQKALSAAMANQGAKPLSTSGQSDLNGFKVGMGAGKPDASFSNISTDGNGNISGNFNGEQVTAQSEGSLHDSYNVGISNGSINPSETTFDNFKSDFEQVSLGTDDNMYVDKQASPQFAKRFGSAFQGLDLNKTA